MNLGIMDYEEGQLSSFYYPNIIPILYPIYLFAKHELSIKPIINFLIETYVTSRGKSH